MPFLASLPSNARVAAFRALQVGDMLCAVPALRALRRALPHARIAVVGLPWARQLTSRLPQYVDELLEFPGHPALPERAPQPGGFDGLCREMAARPFDALIQMHGDGSSTNGIVSQMGVPRLAGFFPASPRHAPPGFMRYPGSGHEIRRLTSLARFLGAPDAGDHMEFPIADSDVAELRAFGELAALEPRTYVCIHPGARDPARRWPPERFAAVADAIHAETGLRVVVTGSQAEGRLAAAVRGAMASPSIDAALPISLGGLAALIAQSRLLVCNDTGVSHIAAALRVPSVVIFMRSDPRRWAPLDRSLHVPVWDPEGGAAAAVMQSARRLLAARAAPPR